MAKYKDIVFSDGTEVRIYVPPTQRIAALVEAADPPPPEPVPPVVKEKTVTGREQVMSIDDDPTYLAELAVWHGRDYPVWKARTTEEINRRGALFVFRDLKVPGDWDVETEVGMIVRLDNPNWEPTSGDLGRKLDYIQWEFLKDHRDSLLVQQTLLELTGIPAKEIEAVLASFRSEVEGETAP